jgi:acetyl/propionyl-CoA carboxylase alpha subunit
VKYIVDLDGQRVPVSISDDGITVAGRPVVADLMSIDGTPARILRVGDRIHRVVARRNGAHGAHVLWIDGWRFDVEALDERTRAIRDRAAASAAHGGPKPVTAPMPGLIVRVLCKVGEVVTAGTPVVVMEAMKMENELRANGDGTVGEILVQVGQAVEKGTLLVRLNA